MRKSHIVLLRNPYVITNRPYPSNYVRDVQHAFVLLHLSTVITSINRHSFLYEWFLNNISTLIFENRCLLYKFDYYTKRLFLHYHI